MRNLAVVFLVAWGWGSFAFGWGELGHRLVAQTAARLVPLHPLLQKNPDPETADAIGHFIQATLQREFMLGQIANIPDVFWRSDDVEQPDLVHRLNPPTHFMDLDALPDSIPLSYAEARKLKENFFREIGTNPWRAEQLAKLYRKTLDNYPSNGCDGTREALAYAGLLSHFTGDASQPYHSTTDHDGEATGQKGIHWYFENHLVNELQDDLSGKVYARAVAMLTAPANQKGVAMLRAKALTEYPEMARQGEVTALLITLLRDGRADLPELRRLDKSYAIATAEEAWHLDECSRTKTATELKAKYDAEKNPAARKKIAAAPMLSADKGEGPAACRRLPGTVVHGKTVAQWHESLIITRIALAAALTADIWVRGFWNSRRPSVCLNQNYALKPSFISPIDSQCEGYATEADIPEMEKKVPTMTPAPKRACVTF